MNQLKTLSSMVRILALVSVLAMVISSVPATQASGAKPGDFDSYLRSKKSPLAGQGSLLDSYGQKYNVDPRLVIAIAGAETTFGTNSKGLNCPQYKNLWNLLDNGKCMKFSSWDGAIQQISAQLRQYREQRKLTTITAIGSTYCQTGCQNWAKNVRLFYSEQGGNPDTAKLTYSFDLGTNGVDLGTYCRNKWGNNIDKNKPVELYGSTANNWYCRVWVIPYAQPQRKDVNVTEACDWQFRNVYVTQSPSGTYPRPAILARTDTPRDPYSWRCYYQP